MHFLCNTQDTEQLLYHCLNIRPTGSGKLLRMISDVSLTYIDNLLGRGGRTVTYMTINGGLLPL